MMKKTKKLIFVLTCLLLAAVCDAETIIVDNYWPYDFDNIQAAIDYSVDGDIIEVHPGRYTGEGNKNIDFRRKGVTVRSVDPSNPFIVAVTIIDCDGLGRGFSGNFYQHYGQYQMTSVIDGLTITNGFTLQDGGGIYCSGGGPTISNCVITGNTAGNGGGIFCESYCQPVISYCTFNGNTAQGNGGAIYYDDDSGLTTTNCTFSGNSAEVDGGGIYCIGESSLTITNCAFSTNTAWNNGGGIFSHNGPLTYLTNCILWGNADISGTGRDAQINGLPGVPDVIFSCIQDDNPNDVNVPFGGADSGNIDDDPFFVRNPNDGGDGWVDDPCTPEDESANNDFGDLHLQVGSPCINAGLPNFKTGSNNDVDMDGEGRILGGRVDMGADEFAPIIVVTKPQGGEVWVNESTHKIEWISDGVNLVDILFSEDAGGGWQTVEAGLADTDSYTWSLPAAVDSNRCLISVVPSIPDADVVCLESGLFTIGPDFYHPDVPSKWKSLGGDFRRTGLSSDYGPEIGCIKWQFETEGAVSASVTIGAGDRVHIACEDGKIYTLDSDGDLIWNYDTNSPLLSSPTVGQDGSIYVGAENGKLYAISIVGTLRWTHNTGGFIYSSPAVSDDGNIYVGSADGTLYALGHDGSELWNFKTDGFGILDGAILASPAIADDGTVYIGGLYDPNLYALDANDGTVKWVCNFEYVTDPCDPANSTKRGWPFASPVVAPDGTIYQTLLYDPNLYAIDPNDGNIIWSTNLADPCYVHAAGWSEPVLGPDGTIYVSFDEPYLRAVNPNGSIKWVSRLGMLGGFTLTVGADGLIYAAGDDGCLAVINSNGEEIARFDNTNWLNFPVIPANNTIIVSGSRDNTMLVTDANNTVWAIGGDGCEGQALALHRPEDLDGSRKVDFADYGLLANHWLESTDQYYLYPQEPQSSSWYSDGMYSTGDINRDLYVDLADVAALANRWLNKE